MQLTSSMLGLAAALAATVSASAFPEAAANKVSCGPIAVIQAPAAACAHAIGPPTRVNKGTEVCIDLSSSTQSLELEEYTDKPICSNRKFEFHAQSGCGGKTAVSTVTKGSCLELNEIPVVERKSVKVYCTGVKEAGVCGGATG